MSAVFQASGLLVMPFWFLVIFLPGWRWTERVVRSVLIVVPAALLYAVLVIPRFLELLPLLARPELNQIVALLGTTPGATIAWVHFLAFDLFVGRWVYLDARERGIPWWISSPVLALVLLFGPLGFVLYVAVSRIVRGGPAHRKAGLASGVSPH